MQRQNDAVVKGPPMAGRGFTLVEILIVVVILGILAAIAVPKLTNASQSARENTLKDDLRFLRTQIAVYQSQHHDVNPGYPGGDASATATQVDFINQMTLYSDDTSSTSATQSAIFKFGPYLSHMPDNPVNGLATITIIAAGGALTPDGTTGWLYQPSTGQIVPNVAGADSDGKVYATQY